MVVEKLRYRWPEKTTRADEDCACDEGYFGNYQGANCVETVSTSVSVESFQEQSQKKDNVAPCEYVVVDKEHLKELEDKDFSSEMQSLQPIPVFLKILTIFDLFPCLEGDTRVNRVVDVVRDTHERGRNPRLRPRKWKTWSKQSLPGCSMTESKVDGIA
ncbi:hypothetical protein L2E82_10884 [Cichorium intybus]|uniref:Uncharacterized protein n=1 Tax=Cichorium intybus TaxID=13427 RepID=A0ACB9GCE4_CICIN|nr:hypothetical protein L2E82_10884 [Cichorium intybus]